MDRKRVGKNSCNTAFMEMERFMWDSFEVSSEEEEICQHIGTCVDLRSKYMSRSYQNDDCEDIGEVVDYRYDSDGVFSIKRGDEWVKPSPSREEYFEDSKFIIDLSRSGNAVSMCFRRLENLKCGFLMYRNMFSNKEKKEQMSCSQSDYYKVIKVDTHVHHSACMNSKHFLKFLKSKLEKSSDEIVYVRGETKYTLAQVFDDLKITKKNLLIDVLNTHAHTDTFHRFDRFNKKYNPYGKPILREIFLKYDNVMKGQFLSEISKEVFHMQEEQKYYYSEYRISIYGKSMKEWNTLSEWVVDNNLFSSHIKWIIQVPRVFNIGEVVDYRYDSDGVFSIKRGDEWVKPSPSREEYFEDSKFIIDLSRSGNAVSMCFRRLENLKCGFLMYRNMFSNKEKKEQMSCSQSDYYKVIKVDTHVHHSACMNSKHFLKFLKSKLEKSSDEIVYVRGETKYTLAQVFDDLKITKKNLLIDVLNTHAHTDTFHRFDRFNKKYNPYGKPILREIFLKYDNVMKGQFLSEISKEVFHMQEEQKYYYSEYRISIYGKSMKEWNTLSEWVVDNNLFSSHIKWIIQVPRVFNIVKEKNISSFGEIIKNIFTPLFEVTKDREANPKLARFLEDVVAFDSVDDETLKNHKSLQKLPTPDKYTLAQNPPYSYYLYYMYANISSLNAFRRSKGLNVFSFRPHSGEAGDPDNLTYAFLVSQSICHGLNLRKSLVMQYLYYVCQIGISMSPLSNNALFLRLKKSPFFDFFMKGLCVCLSTDDPLQFHFTKEPLAEEYSIATQFWMLSSCDQCEIAKNSVLVSNFEDSRKKRWIGKDYKKPFVEGNDPCKTNIPNMRLRFRAIALSKELMLIGKSMSDIFKR